MNFNIISSMNIIIFSSQYITVMIFEYKWKLNYKAITTYILISVIIILVTKTKMLTHLSNMNSACEYYYFNAYKHYMYIVTTLITVKWA